MKRKKSIRETRVSVAEVYVKQEIGRELKIKWKGCEREPLVLNFIHN
jgi:hypothetical protein